MKLFLVATAEGPRTSNHEETEDERFMKARIMVPYKITAANQANCSSGFDVTVATRRHFRDIQSEVDTAAMSSQYEQPVLSFVLGLKNCVLVLQIGAI